jgi:hypothetical protein
MTRSAAMLAVEARGRLIPLGRTHRLEVIEAVADAILQDVRQAAAGEDDNLIMSLLRQEEARLQQAIDSLGLGQGVAKCRT